MLVFGLILQQHWILFIAVRNIHTQYAFMTLAYVANNPCTLAVNKAWNNVYLQGYRKGLYTQVFFMFFIYFVSQILHTFKFKNSSSMRRSVQHELLPSRITEINQERKDEGNQERPELPWHQKRWNRNFSFMFSSHCVALGMVILFSPLAGALVVAYFHLLFFMLYCFCQLKLMITPSKIVRMVLDLLNLVLMIIGAVGINYAQYCKDGQGNLVCCKYL